MTNFEIKCRVESFDHTLKVMESCRAEFGGVMRQIDTYFHVTSGRLKLREIESIHDDEATIPKMNQLIFYRRPDRKEVRQSDYLITEVLSAAALIEQLQNALGIRAIVEKQRTLYLVSYNRGTQSTDPKIRVHLDEVKKLGRFIEIEAVVGGSISLQEAERKAKWLLQELKVGDHDLVSQSYGELILGRN